MKLKYILFCTLIFILCFIPMRAYAVDECAYSVDLGEEIVLTNITLKQDTSGAWNVSSRRPSSLNADGLFRIYYDYDSFSSLYNKNGQCPKFFNIYIVRTMHHYRDDVDFYNFFITFLENGQCDKIDVLDFSNNFVNQRILKEDFRGNMGKDYCIENKKKCDTYCRVAKINDGSGNVDNDGDKPEVSCSDFKTFIDKLNEYFSILKIIVPILVIVLSILEFAKVIFNSDSDEMKKAQLKFVKRLILAAVFFLLPILITAILNLISGSNIFC